MPVAATSLLLTSPDLTALPVLVIGSTVKSDTATGRTMMGMKMSKIDHYMVDCTDEAGDVRFANDTPIRSLTQAKALASKTSFKSAYGAYVVAYTAEGADLGSFVACGHISFYDGNQCEADGTVI